jgi:hypothetical protein
VPVWVGEEVQEVLRRGGGELIPARESISRFAMAKFSPTKRHGDCEEIANPSTAYGRRRRNWTDVHGSLPAGQVVDASCGNRHCIALRHAYPVQIRRQRQGLLMP